MVSKGSDERKEVHTTLVEADLTIFATAPRQTTSDGHETVDDVKQGPGHDDYIIDILQEDHHQGRVSDSFEDGAELPHHTHATHAQVLPDRHLQQEERHAAGDECQQVGD